MKMNLYAAIISGLLILSGCAKDPMPVSIESMRQELLPRGTVSGQLKDTQGTPLLSVRAVTDQGYTGISKNHGFFIIDGLPRGMHSINLIRYGYLDTVLTVEELGINEDFDMGEIILRSSLARVHGHIYSSSGDPLYNASVILVDHPFSAKTNVKGEFSIEGVSTSVRKFMAAHEKEGWGQAHLELNPGTDHAVSITLIPRGGGTLKGVVYKDGKPDSGAIVSVFGGAFIDTAVDGTYQLDNIPCAVPLTVSSGSTRLISGVLIPENDPLVKLDLPELNMLKSGDFAIVERRVFTLENDSVRIFADVRYQEQSTPEYDSAAFFLWKTGSGDAAFDTSTSEPAITLRPIAGRDYQYGIVTVSGDTLCCAEISLITVPSMPQIHFSDSSFSPRSISVSASDSVTLSWHAFDMDGRQLEYAVYFGGSTTSPPSLYRTGVLDTFLTVKPSEGWLERSYLWQVEARSSQSVVRSPVFNFSRSTPLPF